MEESSFESRRKGTALRIQESFSKEQGNSAEVDSKTTPKTIPKPKHLDRSGNTCVCSDKSVKAFGIFDVFVSAVRARVFPLPSEDTKEQISAWPGPITTSSVSASERHSGHSLTSYHTLCCSWAQPPEGLRQETVDKTSGEKIYVDRFGYSWLALLIESVPACSVSDLFMLNIISSGALKESFRQTWQGTTEF